MDKPLRPRSQSNPTSPSFLAAQPDLLGRGRRLTNPLVHGEQGLMFTIQRLTQYPVAGGAHSDVWKAKMMRDGKVISVAYKALRRRSYDLFELRNRLEQEAARWKSLDHQNIATFYGIDYQSNGLPAIVSQWYGNGSAGAYLRRHRENPGVNAMAIILEIATGIEYLHDVKRIVHGDLKGANVMIDDEGHAKLIDFGLSHRIDSDDGSRTPLSFSIRWCAPELLGPNAQTTQASDVYAFASTAFELLTGQVPYSGLPVRAIYGLIIAGMNPHRLSDELRYNITQAGVLGQFWNVVGRTHHRDPLSLKSSMTCISLLSKIARSLS